MPVAAGLDIALQPADRLVNLGDYSRRVSPFPLPYLEQLFVKLGRAELVASVCVARRAAIV